MRCFSFSFLVVFSIFSFFSCGEGNRKKKEPLADQDAATEYGTFIQLAEPLATAPQNKYAKVIGWPEGRTPIAPSGYKVIKFAADLNSPRNIYVGLNGDVFVAQSRTERTGEDPDKAAARNVKAGKSANSILIYRDTDKDGTPDFEGEFLNGLKQPFGMLILADYFYVANTDEIRRYPYKEGDKKINSKGEKILDLPAGGYNNHWTRNLTASKDGSKIYVTVGSGSNVAENGLENEKRRANILEINPDGSGERIYAAGLRNPVGIDFEPHTGVLWTAVNERDQLGDMIVPDYITGVQEDGFYGWPFAYWGPNPDPRLEGREEELVQKTLVPDFALGSHTASLGLSFNKSDKYQEGAYVGQHGSWNRSEFVGYKVVFVPFSNGKPVGEHEDFLTGFIANAKKNEVYGRPVGVTFSPDYMLVADDAANVVWAVLPE
ncbi:sorbosone dehydrogenase family protein [Olivibacter sp. SDN3]|uniref:PQQ-dependent sugar dehydrogenase n=1 Tax=Olivibacter sp. SDN3 TaxID=2764720 RepID=UPI001650E0B8|nr:sorbosone dehydrogenase family protein [Olivibacter sp. SDN3]QNL49047.1 sorbosone dehydrogenase family protein [Olivibacter sp. SDN3]